MEIKTIKCPNCGAPLEEGTRSCKFCGSALIAPGAEAKEEDYNRPEVKELFAAIKDKNLASVKSVFVRYPDLANAKEKDGRSPIHEAAGTGNMGLVEFLLKKGADVNSRNSKGESPLVLALGEPKLFELLISCGANVNVKYDDTFSEEGAELRARGITPLFHAVRHSDKNLMEILLARNADVNAKSGDGDTPLHYAVRYSEKSVVENLLQRGADIDAENKAGDTPLHQAVKKGDRDIVKLLLDRDAKVNVRNREGHTPLTCLGDYMAEGPGSKDRKALARLLVARGGEGKHQALIRIEKKKRKTRVLVIAALIAVAALILLLVLFT